MTQPNETTPDTSTETTTETQAPAADAPKTYDEGTVKGLRTEAANHRVKAREAETKASEAEARATAAETELAALKAQIPEFQTQASSAQGEALRYRVALEAGLPFALAQRLVGSDEETLKADAEVLKGLTGQNAVNSLDLGQGGQGDPPPVKADINAALRALANR